MGASRQEGRDLGGSVQRLKKSGPPQKFETQSPKHSQAKQKIGADHASGYIGTIASREDAGEMILYTDRVYRFAKSALVKSEQTGRFPLVHEPLRRLKVRA